MNRREAIYVFFVMIIFMTAFLPLGGDDHLIQEETRSYMGRTYPTMTRETWIAENKACMLIGQFKTIIRQDLGKKWDVYPDLKAYLESPIEDQAKDKEESIHDIGWDYTPEYDWTVEETNETQVIDGRECIKIIARGDADYAEQIIDMCISKKPPLDTQRYYRLISTIDGKWKDILAAYPKLKDALVVQSGYTRINPIAPTMTGETRLIKVETAEPPPNLYEIPEGMEKVESMEELYRRQK